MKQVNGTRTSRETSLFVAIESPQIKSTLKPIRHILFRWHDRPPVAKRR
jgi:hypothetical protein